MSQPVRIGAFAVPPELFSSLPSLAVLLTATWFFYGRLIKSRFAGSLNLISDMDSRQFLVVSKRGLVLTLQIAVGAIVTFGGTAYVAFALNSLGTAFGSGHLLVGITGLTIGIWSLGRRELPRNILIGINVVTIAYSLLSDAAAGVLTLLPSGAFHDSIIGTAAAVITSGAIIYVLARSSPWKPLSTDPQFDTMCVLVNGSLAETL